MKELMNVIFYSIIYILTLFICTNSELFTSLAHMENGLVAEKNMAFKIKEYIAEEKKRLNLLEK